MRYVVNTALQTRLPVVFHYTILTWHLCVVQSWSTFSNPLLYLEYYITITYNYLTWPFLISPKRVCKSRKWHISSMQAYKCETRTSWKSRTSVDAAVLYGVNHQMFLHFFSDISLFCTNFSIHTVIWTEFFKSTFPR